jgi:hypothetical protein
VVLALCFTSCFRDFFDYGEERVEAPNVPNTTVVTFNNVTGHRVAVYTAFDRNIGNRIAVIEPYTRADSTGKSFFPSTEGYNFFLTYRLFIKNTGGAYIDYGPQSAIPSGPIKRNQENPVPIPLLADILPPGGDGTLDNKVYLAVKNSGTIAVMLGLGQSVLRDVAGENLIPSGQTGVYTVSPGNSSSYRIIRDAYNYDMPANPLTAGNVHCFTFSGTEAAFNTTTPITFENVQ